MKVLGIQLLGVIFGVFMLYLTYLSVKRREFNRADILIWSSIWLSLILASIFPGTLDILMETFDVISAIDFLTIIAVMIIFNLMFTLYKTTRKNQKKINIVIKKLALATAKETKNNDRKKKNNDRRS